MAVDTASKRYSIVGLGIPWRGLMPEPDGTIGTADRAHFLTLYAGIALDLPSAVIYTILSAAVALRKGLPDLGALSKGLPATGAMRKGLPDTGAMGES